MFVVLAIIIPNTAFSQPQIGAFYGVKLGMPKYEVKSKIENQGKTVSIKSITSSSFDSELYLIKNPQLGDVTFDELKLFFKSGKLIQANFVCSDGGGGSPSAPVYGRIESNAKKYKKMFTVMKASFIGKYGTPVLDEEDEVVWRKGNELNLEYRYESEESEMWKSLNTMVLVVYKQTNSGSSNF